MAAPSRRYGHADHWDTLRYEIERWYWEVQRNQLNTVDLSTAMARSIVEEPIPTTMIALGGRWDLRPNDVLFDLDNDIHRVEPPFTIALRAVAEREIPPWYEYEILSTDYGDSQIFVTNINPEAVELTPDIP